MAHPSETRRKMHGIVFVKKLIAFFHKMDVKLSYFILPVLLSMGTAVFEDPGAWLAPDSANTGPLPLPSGWTHSFTLVSGAITEVELAGGSAIQDLVLWIRFANDVSEDVTFTYQAWHGTNPIDFQVFNWPGDSTDNEDWTDVTGDSGVPEPASLVVWSLMAGLGLIVAGRRRMRKG